MNATDDVTVSALKRQLETAVAMLEAITEGSRNLRAAQLNAATEAHAAVEAIQKRLAEAGDGQELWRIQSDWMSASLGKSLAYWRELYEATLQTESSIAKLLAGQFQLAAPLVPGTAGGAQTPLVEMMNGAYNRWIEATRQLHQAPVSSTPATGKTSRRPS